MDRSNSQLFFWRRRGPSYTGYSVAAFLVWAVALAVVHVARRDKASTFRTVFLGWVIGWTSATIGRCVYPPPKRWRPAGPAAGSES